MCLFREQLTSLRDLLSWSILFCNSFLERSRYVACKFSLVTIPAGSSSMLYVLVVVQVICRWRVATSRRVLSKRPKTSKRTNSQC